MKRVVKRNSVFKAIAIITALNVISLFTVGLGELQYGVQLFCIALLVGTMIDGYRKTRMFPSPLVCCLLAVGVLLVYPFPFNSKSEDVKSTFSIEDYGQNIKMTDHNDQERTLLASLPHLTDREMNGEAIRNNVIKMFKPLFPDINFIEASFQLYVDEHKQGYMYLVELDDFEYRIVFNRFGKPIEYAKYRIF